MTGGLADIPPLGARTEWTPRRWAIIAAILILAVALGLRMVNIGWSFSNNGIDEGVMVERVLMVDEGFALYTELPCDQAPLAFLVGAVFGGDVVSLRSLTALVSVAAIACCMYASRRIGGASAMLATGVLLAVDFTLVRESRLFSLDAISASFLAFSVLAFIIHLDRRNLALVSLAGVLAGIACSVKLIGGLALAGMLLFIIVELARKRISRKDALADSTAIILSAAAPLVVLMAALGPSEMIQGMVFDQGHRDFDLFLKLSMLVFLGLCAAYVLPLVCGRRLWRAGPRERFLLSVTVAVLGFMLVQPLLFLHHMVYASPALAILAGVVIARAVEAKVVDSCDSWSSVGPKWACLRRAALPALVASVVVSGGLSSYGLIAQDEPAQVMWGEVVEHLSAEGDYVICGDPMIAAYANRMMPPEVVNVAERQHPELTLERLCDAVSEYNVSVVLICYYLNEFDGFPAYLESEGYDRYAPDVVMSEGKAVLDLFQDGIDPVTVYVRT